MVFYGRLGKRVPTVSKAETISGSIKQMRHIIPTEAISPHLSNCEVEIWGCQSACNFTSLARRRSGANNCIYMGFTPNQDPWQGYLVGFDEF